MHVAPLPGPLSPAFAGVCWQCGTVTGSSSPLLTVACSSDLLQPFGARLLLMVQVEFTGPSLVYSAAPEMWQLPRLLLSESMRNTPLFCKASAATRRIYSPLVIC
eukprot:jgi/Ulvmu1/7631/UM038_0058.1